MFLVFCFKYVQVLVDKVNHKWDKVFKNVSSKICGRQPLKNLKGYSLLKQMSQMLDKSLICLESGSVFWKINFVKRLLASASFFNSLLGYSNNHVSKYLHCRICHYFNWFHLILWPSFSCHIKEKFRIFSKLALLIKTMFRKFEF